MVEFKVNGAQSSRVRDIYFIYFLVRLFAATLVVLWAYIFPDVERTTPLIISILLVFIVFYAFDFVNVWVAFAIPWLIILSYSTLPISDYSRAIDSETLKVVVWVLALGLVFLPAKRIQLQACKAAADIVDPVKFKFLLLGYVLFALLNVVLAGYVPLFSAIFA